MLWPRWLSFAADRYELAYDRELGHMLSFHGYLGDVLVDSVEVTSVSYGASIPQSVLDIERHPDP